MTPLSVFLLSLTAYNLAGGGDASMWRDRDRVAAAPPVIVEQGARGKIQLDTAARKKVVLPSCPNALNPQHKCTVACMRNLTSMRKTKEIETSVVNDPRQKNNKKTDMTIHDYRPERTLEDEVCSTNSLVCFCCSLFCC
jgi:hypothetical protein